MTIKRKLQSGEIHTLGICGLIIVIVVLWAIARAYDKVSDFDSRLTTIERRANQLEAKIEVLEHAR